MSYDATFFLVTERRDTRIDDPDALIVNEFFEPSSFEEIRNAGKNVRICMIDPEVYEEKKPYVRAGAKIRFNDDVEYR